MEIIENKTVDMLTQDSVSILTKKYLDLDGVLNQVGENHRCAYMNSESGRVLLLSNEPENVIASVFAIWGDTPTVEEPKYEVEEEVSETESESESTSESTSESEFVSESESDEVVDSESISE